MKIIKFIFAFVLSVYSCQIALASDYPQSQLEREIDEIGSLAGADGITFRPLKEKSTATKIKIGNINKYLFQAAIEVLKFAPLMSVDTASGTIVTDWYSPKDQLNTQFKVMVYIKTELITPEGLKVIAFERQKVKNIWSENRESTAVSNVLEKKIIKKAKDLYLQAERR